MLMSSRSYARGIAFCWVALSACNPKVSKLEGDSKLAPAPNSEKVDVPVKVAGSYLVCAQRKEAKVDSLSAQYGCRLNEEGTNEKVDLQANLQQVVWTVAVAQANVTVTELEPTNIWHAYYDITGPTVEAIALSSSKIDVQVRWESTPGTASPVTITTERVLDVLKPAADYGDTTAPIVQGADPAAAPKL